MLWQKHQKLARKKMTNILEHGEQVHVFLTSHLLYSNSRIITFSSKKPLAIIYKEIGTMKIRVT